MLSKEETSTSMASQREGCFQSEFASEMTRMNEGNQVPGLLDPITMAGTFLQ